MSNLNLNVVVGGESRVVVAKPYPFPKVPKAPADLDLTLDGMKAHLAATGGGKYPSYIYILVAGKSYYLPKNVRPDTGTEVKVVEAPKVEAESKLKEMVGEGVVEAAKMLSANPEAVEALKAEAKPARGKKSK